MTSRLSVLALLSVAACTFPTDGVPLASIDAAVDPDGNGGVPDACVSGTEVCNGADDDCDGTIDEGVATDTACDGADLDMCLDDNMICDAGGNEVCGNTSGDDDAELCNGPGLDEDCDGATDEGFAVTAACDGGDADLCTEGTNSCAVDGLGVVCSDATGDSVETCNTLDDDCDGTPDDGFDLTSDEANCGTCGNTCTNPLGTTMCMTSACVPMCSNGAAECNGDPDDGCELVDTSPACALPPANPDAVVNGDDATNSTATLTGTTEGFFRVRIRELNSGGSPAIDRDPTARLVLTSGAGTDFDLYVYCTVDCGATPRSAADDTLDVGRADVGGSQTFDVLVEVRYDPTTPSTTCAQWSLQITGDIGVVGSCPG